MPLFDWPIRLSTALVAGYLSFNPDCVAQAAEITFDEMYYSVQFEGDIAKGDYERLRSVALALNIRDNPNQTFPVVLHLNSAGGDLAEAMKIGRLIRALRWMTSAPQKPTKLDDMQSTKAKLKDPEKNYMCASACFFVYVSGAERYGGYKTFIAPLILGVHRPYLSDVDLKAIGSNGAIASATNVRTAVDTYLKEMGVPAKYADLMFSIPKDDIHWLDASQVSELRGFIPGLQDWVDARCDKLADMQRVDCERKVRIELNNQGAKEVFK